jgi:DNA-binding GntR family transcriptional regulator
MLKDQPTMGNDSPASLAQQAYIELRHRIISCRIAPGEWVTESGLAAELAVGKTPTREALRRLAADGFARPARRRGYQVTPVTIGHAIEIFEAFAVLVPEVAVLVARRATPEEKARLAEMAQAASRGEPGDVQPAISMFIELCGNPTIVEMVHGVAGHLTRIINIAASQGALANPRYVDAASATLEAIQGGDVEAVRASALELLEATRSSVLEVMSSAPSVLATPVELPDT